MTLDEAKALLDTCVRDELRDHAFSDAEVYWLRGEEMIAEGYFGLDARDVTIGEQRFTDDDAHALRGCGRLGKVERNDSMRDPIEGEVDDGEDEVAPNECSECGCALWVPANRTEMCTACREELEREEARDG